MLGAARGERAPPADEHAAAAAGTRDVEPEAPVGGAHVKQEDAGSSAAAQGVKQEAHAGTAGAEQRDSGGADVKQEQGAGVDKQEEDMPARDQGGASAASNGAPAPQPGSSSTRPPDASKRQEAASTSGASAADEEALLKEFFSEMRDVDRDNEVNRILWAFKLNPFEKLNLRFDAADDEVRRAYRKTSLMVHPDKCKHPQASAAFDIVGTAHKELLDEEQRAALMVPLDMARDEVRKERKKATKNDTAVQLASLLHENGREGVEAEWERSDEFHEKWKMKARELLAKHAWRKKGLTKRIKDETERAQVEAQEARESAKRQRTHEEQWEKTRDTRVGTWRDFQTKKSSAKKAAGELRPPKQRANDEDKLYVRRPVGEQHRPPPPKPAGKKGKPAF